MALIPLEFFLKKLAVLNTFRVWTGGCAGIFLLLLAAGVWQTMERAQSIDLADLEKEMPQRTEIRDRSDQIIGVLGIDHIKTKQYPELLRDAIRARVSAGRELRDASFLSKVKREVQKVALSDDYGFMALEMAREMFEKPLREQRLLGTGSLIDYILAQRIRKERTSEELMDLYLDRMPFGRDVFGAAAAADHYFQIPLADLDESQLVFLAALREKNLSEATENRKQIAYDQISARLASRIRVGEYPPQLNPRPVISPAISDAANKELDRLVGAKYISESDREDGGITLRFYIDGQLQRFVERAVENKAGMTPTVIIMLDNTDGTILACASNQKGGNLEDLKMKVGEAVRPFVYATALEEGKLWAKSEVSNGLMDRKELKKLKIREEFPIAYPSPMDTNSYTPDAIFSNDTQPMYLRIAAQAGRNHINARLKRVGISGYAQTQSGDVGDFKENLKVMTRAYSVLANKGLMKFEKPLLVSSVHMGNQPIQEQKVALKNDRCFEYEPVWHAWTALRNGNAEDPVNSLTPDSAMAFYECSPPDLKNAQWCLGYSSRITCGVLTTSGQQALTEGGPEMVAHQGSIDGIAKSVWLKAMGDTAQLYPAAIPQTPMEMNFAEQPPKIFDKIPKSRTTFGTALIPYRMALILLSCLLLLTAVFIAIHIHCNKLEARYLRNLR